MRTSYQSVSLAAACRALTCSLILCLAVSALGPIAASAQVRLAGTVPQRAISMATPAGIPSPSESVRFAITLPLRNTQELDDLLRHITNPTDPQYGQYLTPDQFAVRFGPTQADYDAVTQYAKSCGLTVLGTHPNRTILDVAGSVAVVQQAFGLNMRAYRASDGRIFRAPDQNPAVPAAIASRVSGIVGLDNAALHVPHHIQLPPPAFQSRAFAPRGTGPGGYLSPLDIKRAYDLANVPHIGTGQTLGLYELDGYTASDVTAYETQFGLPAVTLENVLIDGFAGTPTAGNGPAEVTLDIELMIALAPGAAKIIVYEAPNSAGGSLDMFNKIATENRAKQISVSWGLWEDYKSVAYLLAVDSALRQMASQGQTIYAASGDSGAYDNGYTLSVDDPASQPYMVGVGGTTLTTGANGAWSSETAWSDIYGDGGGGGISDAWSIPSYQVGSISTASEGSTTMRNVPDVSLDADPSTGYAIYFGGKWTAFGGTSCAAPLWAAFTAIVNEQRASNNAAPLGFPNPTFYLIGQSGLYATDFHDIADGSTNLWYPAVTGYDLATGLGTFDGANLLGDLSAIVRATNLTASDAAGKIGQTVGLQAQLTRTDDGSPVVGETISFSVGGASVGTATTAAGGVATLSYTIPEGAGAGTRKIVARHKASIGLGASSATATLTVSKGDPQLTLSSASASPGSTTVLQGKLLCAGVPVAGRTVSFTLDSTSVGSAVTDGTGAAALSYIVPTSISLGKHALSAAFDGTADNAYTSVNAGGATLNVAKLATGMSLYASTGQVGGTTTLRVLLMSGVAPVVGRTITFTVDGVYPAGSGVTNSAGVASTTFAIPLAFAGVHNVTCVFDGTSDVGYYSTSRTTAALTVVKLQCAFSLYMASGASGSNATLKALLLSGAGAVVGRSVTFTVLGSKVGPGATDNNGVVAVNYTVPLGTTAGLYNVTATFDGTADLTYSSATRTTLALNVQKAATSITISNVNGSRGQPVNLQCFLSSNGVGVPAKTVSFWVDGTPLGSTATNSSGVATMLYRIPATAAVGAHTVKVVFDGTPDSSYLGSSQTASALTVN